MSAIYPRNIHNASCRSLPRKKKTPASSHHTTLPGSKQKKPSPKRHLYPKPWKKWEQKQMQENTKR